MYSHISARICYNLFYIVICQVYRLGPQDELFYLLRIFCYLDCFLERRDLDRSIYNCYSVL